MSGEWSVVVLGPHFAAALVGRDLGDTGPDRERRFAFATVYDRALVIAAARTLVARIAPRTAHALAWGRSVSPRASAPATTVSRAVLARRSARRPALVTLTF